MALGSASNSWSVLSTISLNAGSSGSTSNSEQFSPASTNKGKILPPPPPLKGNKIPTTSPKETFTPGQLIDIPVGSNTIPPGRYVMKTLKDADGDPINVLVSQDGKKAYPVEKDLKSISFTLVNTAPVIPDHDVGNNIAKRPVISNVPNKIQAESFIKKMAEESGDARITAEVITGNLNHVTQPQFEKALEASIEDFNSSIDDNTSYAVIGGRSRKWTFDLAKEKGMKGSKSAVVIGDSELEIKRMLQENSRIKNIVLIDDASYSGNQLNEYITSIQAQAKLAGREVQIHIVTPFMTNYSQKRLMRPGVTIVAHETIQTIHEIAESEAQKRGIPKEKVIQVLRERYDLRQDDGRSVGLTYFDHKIPDNQSFLATRQNRLNVLRGIVVDSNGNEKVIGTREEQIPFLEDDGTTSLITTTLPIYDEAPISQQTQTPY